MALGTDAHAVRPGPDAVTGQGRLADPRVTGLVAIELKPLAVTWPAGPSGQVWALETDPADNAVYVGGDFGTVNGVSRSGLVKQDATTGAPSATFKPYFSTGKVNDLLLLTRPVASG